jgi:hypothetical protein
MTAVQEQEPQKDESGYIVFRVPADRDESIPAYKQLEWKWVPNEIVVLVHRIPDGFVVNYSDGTTETVLCASHLPCIAIAEMFVQMIMLELKAAVRQGKLP